jgi:hypothetical protein
MGIGELVSKVPHAFREVVGFLFPGASLLFVAKYFEAPQLNKIIPLLEHLHPAERSTIVVVLAYITGRTIFSVTNFFFFTIYQLIRWFNTKEPPVKQFFKSIFHGFQPQRISGEGINRLTESRMLEYCERHPLIESRFERAILALNFIQTQFGVFLIGGYLYSPKLYIAAAFFLILWVREYSSFSEIRTDIMITMRGE